MKTTDKQKLAAFITANAPFLTYADMAEETGEKMHTVRTVCTRLGITPITRGEQTRQYIIDHHKRRTVADIARLLQIREVYVLEMIAEMGLTPFMPQSKGKSVGQILGSFRLAGDHHRTLAEMFEEHNYLKKGSVNKEKEKTI